MLNIDVVRRGVLIGSTTKLGNKSGGVLIGRNLSQSSTLLATTIGVVGIHNLKKVIHGNRTAYQSLMSLMVVGRCKRADAMY